MRCLLIAMALALLLPAAGPTAFAQAAAPAGWLTITSPKGYLYQVPPDWQTISAGAGLPIADTAAQSPDGQETALVIVLPAPPGTLDDLSDIPQNLLEAESFAGVSGANFLDGPKRIDILNADAGVALSMSYNAEDGTARVVGGRVAAEGSTLYFFVIDAAQNAYSADPDFNAVLDSFQLR